MCGQTQNETPDNGCNAGTLRAKGEVGKKKAATGPAAAVPTLDLRGLLGQDLV